MKIKLGDLQHLQFSLKPTERMNAAVVIMRWNAICIFLVIYDKLPLSLPFSGLKNFVGLSRFTSHHSTFAGSLFDALEDLDTAGGWPAEDPWVEPEDRGGKGQLCWSRIHGKMNSLYGGLRKDALCSL